MTSPTALPQAAAVAARLLVQTHRCIVCKGLPERPFVKADEVPGQDYRPRKPADIVSGKTARSFRCKRHERARKRVQLAGNRIHQKTLKYGLTREQQRELWEFQGRACPCGRRAAPQVPAGVTLDHDHGAPCIARGDHDEKRGCVECCTGFVCSYCNLKILGFLEGCFQKAPDPRAAVATALAGLHAHVSDPPLARLRVERPDLFEGVAA